MIPNPFMPYPTVPQTPIMPTVQPVQQPQQQIRVSGRDEAMNRFIMMYPAHF